MNQGEADTLCVELIDRVLATDIGLVFDRAKLYDRNGFMNDRLYEWCLDFFYCFFVVRLPSATMTLNLN